MTARVKGWSKNRQLSFRSFPELGSLAYRPHQVRSIQSRPPGGRSQAPHSASRAGSESASSGAVPLCQAAQALRDAAPAKTAGPARGPSQDRQDPRGLEPTRQAPQPLGPAELTLPRPTPDACLFRASMATAAPPSQAAGMRNPSS